MTREEALEINAAAAALFDVLQVATNFQELVDNAYANLLGLEGDFSNAASRKAFWIEQLESGALSEDDFASEFLFLAENVPGNLTEEEQAYNKGAVPAAVEASNAVVEQLKAEGRDIQDLTGEEIIEVTQSIREAASQAGQLSQEQALEDTFVFVSLDGLESTDLEPALFDAGEGSFLFDDDVALQSNTRIENFGEDDLLRLIDVSASDVRVQVSGDNTQIQFDDGEGQLSQIELVGVHGFFTSVDEFNQNAATGDILFA